MVHQRDGPAEPPVDLIEKAKPAVFDEEIVALAGKFSPSAIRKEVLWRGHGDRKSRAARFLAIILRDYGRDTFERVVESLKSSHALKKRARLGGKPMPTKAKPEVPVATESQGAIPIPLQKTFYNAQVSGTTASVMCRQLFANKHTKPVEAVYAFPMPAGASVTGCRMKIGSRTVVAELKKRAEARQTYDDAVAAGHHASLLEQERPNIFTMNVGGIEPREQIEVEVRYIEQVLWESDGARFRIPLVAAPRFIPGNPTGKSGGGWSPDTDQVPDASKITPVVAREGVKYTANIRVKLSPGFRCRLSCPSHPTIVSEQELTPKRGTTINTGEVLTDRDFTLVYTPTGTVPQVAAHRGTFDGEMFAILNVIPPVKAKPEPMDIALLLDVSGSMDGSKIAGLKVVAEKLVQKLQAQGIGHNLAVIKFSDSPDVLAGLSNIAGNEQLIQAIRGLTSEGGTQYESASLKAYDVLGTGTRAGKYVVFITDGQSASPFQFRQGVRVITVGIDSAADDAVLKEIARKSGGVSMSFYSGEDYDMAAGKIAGKLAGPVLTVIRVEPAEEAVGVEDVFEGSPATIAVRFKAAAAPKALKLTGKDPSGKEQSFIVQLADSEEFGSAAQLWARKKISETGDEGVVTAVSLRYGVISAHTSFVAVSEKQVPGQKPERVEIPVNLPTGWVFERVFGGAAAAVPGIFPLLTGLGVQRMVAREAPVENLFAEFGDTDTDLGPTPSAALFKPYAQDPADAVIGVLIALDGGRREEAEQAFQLIQKKLTAKLVRSWGDEKRARTYYFALRLSAFGMRLDSSMMSLLSRSPKASSAWYALALKEQGRPFKRDFQLPAGSEGVYVGWKLGSCDRPTEEPWCLVP